MNAWGEDERIHVDVMQANAPALFPRPDGSPVPEAGGLRLSRWSMDVNGGGRAGRVRQTWLSELRGDFPRIDERFTGQP